MTIDYITELGRGKLQLVEPAATDKIRVIEDSFPDIYTSEYIDIIRKSNGLGEIFTDGKLQFVHNTIICSADDAITLSKEVFSINV